MVIDLVEELKTTRSNLDSKAVTSLSREELELFWELDCEEDEQVFMERVWERLEGEADRLGCFRELMERATILYESEWELFLEENGAEG